MKRLHVNIAKKSAMANKFLQLLKNNDITNKKYYFSVAISSYINDSNICIANLHNPSNDEIASYKQITTAISLKEDLYDELIKYCEVSQLDISRVITLALENAITIIPTTEEEKIFSDHEISKNIISKTTSSNTSTKEPMSKIKIENKASNSPVKSDISTTTTRATIEVKKTIPEASTPVLAASEIIAKPKSKTTTKKSSAAKLGLDYD